MVNGILISVAAASQGRLFYFSPIIDLNKSEENYACF